MTSPDVIIEDHEDEAFDDADIVEWYEARPITLSTAAVTGAVISAFALGALTAVGALFLMGRLDD